MRRLSAGVALVLLASACLGDPAGPGVLDVSVEGGGVDTLWLGAPGEPMPSAIRVHVLDDHGRPLPGASVEWEAVGQGAQVTNASSQSNASGVASAGWLLGTDAAEEQRLQVTVRSSRRDSRMVIRARAVPHVVAQVRVLVDSAAVLRLGDTLPVRVEAVDPYGNVFPAPDVAITRADTSVVTIAGPSLIGGPRRGQSAVRVASHGVEAFFSLRVVQYVAAIVPAADTLKFSALGAERPVAYVVRDDRGRVVADTMATLMLGDASVAQLSGEYVRAVAPGVTAVRLTLGSAAATIAVDVQQKVGSLRLIRDTIRLDALLDTTTVDPVANDSLGAPIAEPDLVYNVSDAEVVRFASGRTLEAVSPGAALVTVQDTVTGVSASAPVVVRQVVAMIELPSSQISFDALGDTLTLNAVARDRLGSVVPDAALDYTVDDANVVAITGSQLRSVAPGQTLVVVRDPETGLVGTAQLRVEQRAAALRLANKTVAFDALGDTIPLAVSAWDRLGASIANASVAYRSTDASAVVSPEGFVTSQDNGSALVIAQSADGPADTAQVTVAQRVTAIALARTALTFESLRAVQTVQALAVDRRGVRVAPATLNYVVEDTSVAAVDEAGQVVAVANGATRLLVMAAEGDTGVIDLTVAQRPVRVVTSPDTIRFDALGDVQTVSGVALDSLGSPLAGDVSSVVVTDTSVVETSDSVTLVARANGVSTASLTVAGITGEVVVVVDQVATSLTVTPTFGTPIVTLPVGAPFPLECAATDRNGNVVARDPALSRTVRGTVMGAGCEDARVARSGYDTLVFVLGTVEVRLPVIVATAPDSINILATAEPLTTLDRERFVGEDLAHPLILALRPLVNDILAAYGNPTGNLDRARAIRDWVARTAISPDPAIHQDGSTSNLSVLPSDKTWRDVNSAPGRWDESAAFWDQQRYEGYRMLDRLLGTLDTSTGLRADDGMMVHVSGARYRIKDIATYRYLLCSYQAIIANALWAAAGLHGVRAATLGHDPAAVFIPELGRWVYEDPTFNEEYQLDGAGDPLSPVDLLTLSSTGQASRLRAKKFVGPSFDPEVYVGNWTYLMAGHPQGMLIMGGQVFGRVVGNWSWSTRYVQIDVPTLATAPTPFSDPSIYARVTAAEAFPTLGPTIGALSLQDSVYVVQLASTFPNHSRFERRVSGQEWNAVAVTDVLPVGACRVEYRSVDSVGNVSAVAVVDVWAPRTENWTVGGSFEGVRAQSEFCVTPSVDGL